MTPSYDEYYAVIRRIPGGRVATYGQVAAAVGRPRNARQVGYALAALPDGTDVPWHRVVNAGGSISARAEPGREGEQRRLLESEGIVFDARDRIDLKRWQWRRRAVLAARPLRRGLAR
ncbi:MAG: methyltransferase [Gammaproteobacteria bacterium]|nr:MGMT family protein [Gammaproteobacteria bacterium]NNL99297.1 methyltransferase [Gammaproteobacteria bacterium]